jgi:hypothetical protein
MISQVEQVELAKVIDEVINIQTQRHIAKDMHHMSQTGQPQPTSIEMPNYVRDSRQGVAEILAQLN